MCVCVAVDEEPEQDDVMAEDTSGSEARNETGTPIQQLIRDNQETKICVFHAMADDDIDREADLQEDQIVSCYNTDCLHWL